MPLVRLKDMQGYIDRLQQFVYHSGTFMKPVFQVAKNTPADNKRIVFAEGEEERVLRAVQVIVDEKIAHAHFDRPPGGIAVSH